MLIISAVYNFENTDYWEKNKTYTLFNLEK